MRNLESRHSLLEIGAFVALATLGLAGTLGLIAVLGADHVSSAFGTGFGIALAVFVSGSTIVCALACLARGRAELVALGSIIVTGIALDLFVLAIWRDIDSEGYGKVVGIGLAWSLFALIALGLTLAVDGPSALARWLYLGALISTVGAGLISSYLIATTGGGGDSFSDGVPADEGIGISVVGLAVGDDELLRALGAAFVLLAAFWFGAIAAHRLERAAPADV